MSGVLAEKLAAGWWAEYRSALRDYVLPSPHYCKQMHSDDLMGLFNVFMDRMEKREVQSSNENSQNAVVLELLLRSHHVVRGALPSVTSMLSL
jgi:hypothetical protein